MCSSDLEGVHTYYDTSQSDGYHVMREGIPYVMASRGTSLIQESKQLNLTIEVYSEECGMGFQEHIAVVNGDLMVNDCVDYQELYWDKDEFPTLEEFNKEYEVEATLDDFEDGEYYKTGGFEEWYYEY